MNAMNTMNTRNTITLSGVGKSYGRTTALTEVTLDLGPGITGLLGPNGAGKTTILRILATSLAADRGTVRVLGEDPRSTSGRTTVRRHLGYVPQETGFPRGFTAFSFVDYIAILKEWSDADDRHEEVRRVLGLVDLTDVAPKRVGALSGGQRRRLVLAQALLGHPDLLVLDEPTAGLDPAQRGRLRDVLGQAGESATVVISTHQTGDVAALCERVIVLDGGQVLFDGRVVDLVRKAAGRVWMADERHPAARHAWRTGTGRVRNVGDPPADAELIDPDLEDAYLLLVGDAGDEERLEAVS
jgi:ABC-2 type transport system ATP-binding protein